jgi:hypothetical protein
MEETIYVNDLCFVDERPNQLTIGAQENIKKTLLEQARERACRDSNQLHFNEKVHYHYYDVLAAFMNAYPTILIDLVLIKLDEPTLN